MNSVFHLAIKDLKLVSRDWLGMFFIAGFPVCLGLFFGMVGGAANSGGSNPLPLAVVDEDQSTESRRLIELLEQDGSIATEQVEKQRALDQVRRGQRTGVMVLPQGFGQSAGLMWAQETAVIQLGTDPSRKAEAGMLEGYLMKAMGQLTMERFQDIESMQPTVDEARQAVSEADDLNPAQKLLLGAMFQSLDGFLDSMSEWQESEDGAANEDGGPSFELAKIETLDLLTGKSIPDSNESEGQAEQNPVTPQSTSEDDQGRPAKLVDRLNSPWDISFPSAILWGVMGCIAGFAVSIVRERTRGTLVRLQVAPISRRQILFGKGLACFIAVMLVIILLIGLGIALGMRPGNYAQLLLAALCLAYCNVGIMMLMSVIGKTEEAVSGACWGINVIAAMFGGAMIPLAFLPSFMIPLSHASPVKWGILALEGAIWRQFTWSEMLVPCAVLLAVGTIGTTIGAVLLSRE